MRIRYQAILLYLARATGQFTLLVVAMILARMMSKDQYGTVGQILMIAAMGVSVLHMGTSQGIGFFFPRMDESQQRALVCQMLIYLTAAGVALALAAFVASDYLAEAWDNPELAGVLKLAAIWIGLQILPTLTPMALIAKQHPTLGAIVPVVLVSLSRAALPIAFFFTSSIETMFLVATVVAVPQFLISAYFMAGYAFRGVSFPEVWPSLKEVASKCVPLGATALAATLAMWLDKLFIASYYGPSDFAVFRNGAFEIPFLTMLSASVFTVLLPTMSKLASEGDCAGSLSLWKQGVEKCAIVLVPMAAFFILFSTESMLFLFGPKYAASGPVFRIYSLAVLVRIAMYGPLFVCIGKPIVMTLAIAVSLAVTLGANFLMLALIGFVGPAVANVSVTFMQAAALLVIASKLYDTTFANIFPWAKIAKIIVSASLAAASASVAFLVQVNPLLRLLIGFVILISAYAVAGRITGAISAEEFRSAWQQSKYVCARLIGKASQA